MSESEIPIRMQEDIISEILGLQGWQVKEVVFGSAGKDLELHIERRDPGAFCPECGQTVGFCTRQRSQRIRDLGWAGKRVALQFIKRDIRCTCGYSGVESLEWLSRYERATSRFRDQVYQLAKRMCGTDVAKVAGMGKDAVYELDREGIEREWKEQPPLQPDHLGMDEISIRKGHHYATIISAPKLKKILDVLKTRKKVALTGFFEAKGKDWCQKIRTASMDAWKAFRTAVQKHCCRAAICYDHFHITMHLSRAIDILRVQEARKQNKAGQEVFKGTRWLLLKNQEHLKETERQDLDQLLKLNKKLAKAHLLKEQLREVFKGPTPRSRLRRFSLWQKMLRSVRGAPSIRAFSKKVNAWRPYILNALRENVSNSFGEGLNNKVRLVQRMAYGYRDFDYFRLKVIQQFNFRRLEPKYSL
jgi:transposase